MPPLAADLPQPPYSHRRPPPCCLQWPLLFAMLGQSGVAHFFLFRPCSVLSIAYGASFVITLWIFFLLEKAGLGLSRRALSPSG